VICEERGRLAHSVCAPLRATHIASGRLRSDKFTPYVTASLLLCLRAAQGCAQITAVFAADLKGQSVSQPRASCHINIPPSTRSRTRISSPRSQAGMRNQLKEVGGVAENSDKPTFTTQSSPRAHRRCSIAPSAHFRTLNALRYKSDPAEDRQRNGAETCCAPDEIFLNPKFIRASPGALREAR